MSYPQGGYQQQPWQQGGPQPGQPGQPGPMGQGGYNYPAQSGGSPATAIIAAILGIAAAILLAIAAFDITGELPSDPPSQYTIIVVLMFAAGAVCLVGAILAFVRQVAGAFVLLIGAIAVAAAVLLQPMLISSALEDLGAPSSAIPSFGDFFEALFEFDSTQTVCEAIALICAPILLVFSVIPPTLNWLRGSSAQAFGGGYPQQQGGYQSW